MTYRWAVLFATLAVLFMTRPVLAAPIVDFSNAGTGGLIYYTGSGGDLTGTHIAITTVTGIGTPLESGNHTVTWGFLNFTTGNLVSFKNGVYTFGPGGTFTITGGVPGASIPIGTTLLTGQLSTVSVKATSGTVYLLAGSGSDILNSTLEKYFGMSGGPFGLGPVSIGIDITRCWVCASTGFAGTAYNIQVPDGPAPAPVPEPASLLLLGSGLLLSSAFLRRRHVPRS